MEDKIIELLKQNKRVSKHCVTEDIYKKNNILDISKNLENPKDFIMELSKEKNVSKIIHPIQSLPNSSKIIFDKNEQAIHIEIVIP
ncbi:hypothetical protein [Aliarcobacter skirrowii]|uniref:hypothetical protein n=1 Tax=Aliarcobacter skirrowii TaxID=28200 RepID=UPI000A8CDE17|nr:hypothetical protein [Aliarcobacter skirrowii]